MYPNHCYYQNQDSKILHRSTERTRRAREKQFLKSLQDLLPQEMLHKKSTLAQILQSARKYIENLKREQLKIHQALLNVKNENLLLKKQYAALLSDKRLSADHSVIRNIADVICPVDCWSSSGEECDDDDSPTMPFYKKKKFNNR